MRKYLITYHGGGGMPPNPEAAAKMKAAFGAWLQSTGKAVVDPGAPVAKKTSVAKGTALPAFEIGGYSIVQAESEQDVVRILKTHPFVERGGTLQVNEVMAI
jgi:hypothetical protein